MQATLSGKHTLFNRTRLAIAAAGLLAVTIAGMAVVTLDTQSSDTAASRTSPAVTTTMPAWRFAEINELPVTSVRPAHGLEGWQFREINAFPDTPAATPASYGRQRFIEINQLPSDGGTLDAPEMVPGTRS